MIEFVNIFTDLRTLAKIREHLAEKVSMHGLFWHYPPVGVDFAEKFQPGDLRRVRGLPHPARGGLPGGPSRAEARRGIHQLLLQSMLPHESDGHLVAD